MKAPQWVSMANSSGRKVHVSMVADAREETPGLRMDPTRNPFPCKGSFPTRAGTCRCAFWSCLGPPGNRFKHRGRSACSSCCLKVVSVRTSGQIPDIQFLFVYSSGISMNINLFFVLLHLSVYLYSLTPVAKTNKHCLLHMQLIDHQSHPESKSGISPDLPGK